MALLSTVTIILAIILSLTVRNSEEWDLVRSIEIKSGYGDQEIDADDRQSKDHVSDRKGDVGAFDDDDFQFDVNDRQSKDHVSDRKGDVGAFDIDDRESKDSIKDRIEYVGAFDDLQFDVDDRQSKDYVSDRKGYVDEFDDNDFQFSPDDQQSKGHVSDRKGDVSAFDTDDRQSKDIIMDMKEGVDALNDGDLQLDADDRQIKNPDGDRKGDVDAFDDEDFKFDFNDQPSKDHVGDRKGDFGAFDENNFQFDVDDWQSQYRVSDRKGDFGAFDDDDHEIGVDEIQSEDKAKNNANQTTSTVRHGINGGIWYKNLDYEGNDANSDYDNNDDANSDYDNNDDANSDYDNNDDFKTDSDYNNDDEDDTKLNDNNRRRRPGNDNNRRRRPENDNNRRRRPGNNNRNCQTCGGVSGAQNLDFVVNGSPVRPMHKYPWIVSIKGPMGDINCAGAIISATFIITAGHCLMSTERESTSPQCKRKVPVPRFCHYRPNELTVGLLGRCERERKSVKIAQVIVHERYDNSKILHDIGLLRLATPIQCNQFSSPICLPTTDLNKMGRNLLVAGWGFNSPGAQRGPQILMEGKMKQIQGKVCKSRTRPFSNKVEDIVCAIGTQSRQSSCQGDSGSSIVAAFGSKFYSLGITSRHSTQLCHTNMPVTYAKVYRYISWIKRRVRNLPRSNQ